jgi:hypothetical protein
MLPERAEALAHNAPTDGFADAMREMFAGMKTYGKQLDAMTLAAYMRVLINIRATQAEIDSAAGWFLEHEDEFPTPRRMAAWIKERRLTIEYADALGRSAREEREARVREVEEWCLEAFGTLEPTREQVRERLAGNPVFEAATGDKPTLALRRMPEAEYQADPEKLEARDRLIQNRGDE